MIFYFLSLFFRNEVDNNGNFDEGLDIVILKICLIESSPLYTIQKIWYLTHQVISQMRESYRYITAHC
jgi:hypothetical protein